MAAFSFNKQRPPSKGQNLRTTLRVSFNESVFGCTKTIAIKTLVWCSNCSGLGATNFSSPSTSSPSPFNNNNNKCEACSGTGTYSQRSSLVTINSTCSACGGRGIVVDETTKCKCCHHGRVHHTKELRIDVPAGVMKNMRKIYEGQGDVGEYGGEAGDMIVVFDVDESPIFSRDGDHATCDARVTFFQAALGARLAVPGLYGHLVQLDVPTGTQPLDLLRVAGEGFVNVATRERGDLYVRVVLDIPKMLTPQQADLLARAQHRWNQVSSLSSPTSPSTTTTTADYYEPTSIDASSSMTTVGSVEEGGEEDQLIGSSSMGSVGDIASEYSSTSSYDPITTTTTTTTISMAMPSSSPTLSAPTHNTFVAAGGLPVLVEDSSAPDFMNCIANDPITDPNPSGLLDGLSYSPMAPSGYEQPSSCS